MLPWCKVAAPGLSVGWRAAVPSHAGKSLPRGGAAGGAGWWDLAAGTCLWAPGHSPLLPLHLLMPEPPPVSPMRQPGRPPGTQVRPWPPQHPQVNRLPNLVSPPLLSDPLAGCSPSWSCLRSLHRCPYPTPPLCHRPLPVHSQGTLPKPCPRPGSTTQPLQQAWPQSSHLQSPESLLSPCVHWEPRAPAWPGLPFPVCVSVPARMPPPPEQAFSLGSSPPLLVVPAGL